MKAPSLDTADPILPSAARTAADLPPMEPPEGGATRPSGINISTATVTQATAHLPDEQRALVRWLHDHIRTNRMQWADITAVLEMHSSTISRMFNDTYRYPKEIVERDRDGNIIKREPHPKAQQRIPIDSICDKIKKFKRRVVQEGRTENPDFVNTSIAERIHWLCDRVARNKRIGFIWGESQIGKTTALKQYAATHNGGATYYCEMPPSSGVQFMLKCLARSLHVSPKAGFEDLIEDIIGALDDSKMLLLDETQRVFTTYQKGSVMRCLDTLRYIHDRSKCGLVLCGTNVLREKVDGGEFAQYLKQLRRRGRSYELQLPTEAPREDLDLIAAKFGLDPAPAGSMAEQIMLHMAHEDGIGVFALRLRDAQDYARNKKHDLCWDDFVKAFGITEKSSGRAARK